MDVEAFRRELGGAVNRLLRIWRLWRLRKVAREIAVAEAIMRMVRP